MTVIERIVTAFEVKELDEDARTFQGYASTWDLDLGDDRIHKGAFRDSIAAWRKGKKAMPLLNSHNHFDINSIVGQMIDAKEDTRGLLTGWEVIDGKDGDDVIIRLRPSHRTGRAPLGAMSIGYEAQKYDYEDDDAAKSGQIRNLWRVGLKEVSLVIFPMNPAAEVDVGSVKMQMKHASAETLDEVRSFLDGLANGATVDGEHENNEDGETPPVAGNEKSAWATPGDTPLDRIMIKRMLTRSRAL